MSEMDGIVADSIELEQSRREEERKELDSVRAMLSNRGNITG